MQQGLEKNFPEKRFSAGAVSVTVWKNQRIDADKNPVFFRTVTLQRGYNKDGSWHSSQSLRAADLPKAVLLLDKAYEWLVLAGEAE